MIYSISIYLINCFKDFYGTENEPQRRVSLRYKMWLEGQRIFNFTQNWVVIRPQWAYCQKNELRRRVAIVCVTNFQFNGWKSREKQTFA